MLLVAIVVGLRRKCTTWQVGYVAKNKCRVPGVQRPPTPFVEKNQRVRLHIAPRDVELLSLPSRPHRYEQNPIELHRVTGRQNAPRMMPAARSHQFEAPP